MQWKMRNIVPRVMIRKTKETLEKITRYTYLYTPCPLRTYL